MAGISKPYYRIYRSNQLDDGYILDSRYADDRHLLCRAYKIIENDLLKLFEYVEPSDDNKNTFSQRTYELLLRASTEFETNCKQLLLVNGYNKHGGGNWNMSDYQRINQATKLSEYEIQLNIWNPSSKIFRPLSSWENSGSLSWYQDYNKVKHDRSSNFQKAKLINVVSAVAAVWAILYAQFGHYIFEPYNDATGGTSGDDGFDYSDSTLFSIKPFSSWPKNKHYTFRWPTPDKDPFQRFPF